MPVIQHQNTAPRTAQSDRCSDTDDISRSDRGGKRCCKRSELTDFSVCPLFFCNRKPNPFCNCLSLDKSCANCQKQMRSQQKCDHPPAPYEIVCRLNDLVYFIIHTYPALLLTFTLFFTFFTIAKRAYDIPTADSRHAVCPLTQLSLNY